MGAQNAKEPKPSASKNSKAKPVKEPRVSQGNIFSEHSGKYKFRTFFYSTERDLEMNTSGSRSRSRSRSI